jgi:hypothetical protein
LVDFLSLELRNIEPNGGSLANAIYSTAWIAAVNCRRLNLHAAQCRFWVKRYRWILRLWRPMTVVAPTATVQGGSAT